MQKFTRVEALAVTLAAPNIDTDQIIPARFLWHKQSDGYAKWLFNDQRRDAARQANPDFVLNRKGSAGAQILVGERNFGCGSSREQAVWALQDYGFKVIIAPSFGDIFYNNCFKQGVLAVTLPDAETARLREAVEQGGGARVTVDLERQTISGPGGFSGSFEIAAFRRQQLLEGLDDIAITLQYAAAIDAFEAVFDKELPWLLHAGP